MFLSGLLIDAGENPDRPRPGRLWLRNVYRVHQRLSMAFPSSEREAKDPLFLQPFKPTDFINEHTGDQKHEHVHGQRTAEQAFLFRIDPLSTSRTMIVVQSAIKPNWHYAFQNADYLLAGPPIGPKVFDPAIENGQLFSFRLLANPTRKINTKTREDGTKSNGTRVPVAHDKIKDWLTTRSSQSGFAVESFLDVQTGYISSFKDKVSSDKEDSKNGLNFFYTRYNGTLRVTDKDAMHNTIIQGIGSAKGFGFGLLSIAPIKE
jgi:CRISPR system Cascade subunit CasE